MRHKRSWGIAFSMLMLLALSIGVIAAKATPGTIVEVASGNKDFSTLCTAVKAAGLVDTLNGKGPFTVFAPTNAAFAKLPKKTLANLLKPENKAKLAAILTYHVVSGKVTAAEVMKMKSPTMVGTVNGAKITITHTKHSVNVNKAKVTKPDVIASNGVIHVIDTVLMPPKK